MNKFNTFYCLLYKSSYWLLFNHSFLITEVWSIYAFVEDVLTVSQGTSKAWEDWNPSGEIKILSMHFCALALVMWLQCIVHGHTETPRTCFSLGLCQLWCLTTVLKGRTISCVVLEGRFSEVLSHAWESKRWERTRQISYIFFWRLVVFFVV